MHDTGKKSLKIIGSSLLRILITLAILGLLLWLILAFSSCVPFVYEVGFKVTDVAKEASPDGRYEAILQTHGEPISFGPTPLRVIVQTKDGNVLEEIEDSVANDGGILSDDNWMVVWEEEQVSITLRGCEQEDETYQVELTGS